MRRVRNAVRDLRAPVGWTASALAVVLLAWALSGHFLTAFYGKVDWPIRSGTSASDAPVPAWLLYVVFPTVVLALAAAGHADARKQRRHRSEPWWDYTPSELDAMSLDDLRAAYERAIDYLEPRPPGASEADGAERAHERYLRLRDAYDARRKINTQ